MPVRPEFKNTEVKEVKLDQTTARVVTELAGQLMPPLVNALDKSIKNSADKFALKRDEIVDKAALNSVVQAGVQSGTEQLSQVIAQIFSDNSAESAERVLEIKNSLTVVYSELSALSQRLIKSGETVSEILKIVSQLASDKSKNDRESTQDAAQLTQPVLDGLYSLSVQLGDFREAQRDIKSHGQVINNLKTAIDRLCDKCDKINAEIQDSKNKNFGNFGNFEDKKVEDKKAENKKAEDKKDFKDNDNKNDNKNKAQDDRESPDKNLNYINFDEISENVNSIKSMVLGLEGIIRALGHAQSRELEALSQELLTMQNQTGATMIQAVQETTRQEAVERDAEFEDRLEAEHDFIEMNIKKLNKILWIMAGLCGGAFILSLIKLFL